MSQNYPNNNNLPQHQHNTQENNPISNIASEESQSIPAFPFNHVDQDFENGLRILRETHAKKIAYRDAEIMQLRAEIQKKDSELKEMTLRLSLCETQVARSDKKLTEMSRAMSKLQAFKQSVMESLAGDDGMDVKDDHKNDFGYQYQHTDRQSAVHQNNNTGFDGDNTTRLIPKSASYSAAERQADEILASIQAATTHHRPSTPSQPQITSSSSTTSPSNQYRSPSTFPPPIQTKRASASVSFADTKHTLDRHPALSTSGDLNGESNIISSYLTHRPTSSHEEFLNIPAPHSQSTHSTGKSYSVSNGAGASSQPGPEHHVSQQGGRPSLLSRSDYVPEKVLQALREDERVSVGKEQERERDAVSSSPKSKSPAAPGYSIYAQSSVDGRDFFKKARATMSYDEFTVLLSNVKAYNAREQSRHRTLENLFALMSDRYRDLYDYFEKLLSKS